MKDLIDFTFPIVVCGKQFNSQEEWEAEGKRIEREYPELCNSILKCIKEEWDMLDFPFMSNKLKLYARKNDEVQRKKDNG